MTTDAGARTRDALLAFSARPIPLWIAFVLVHLWLGAVNLRGPGWPLGDVVSVYPFWAQQGLEAGYWQGIHAPWVYPILAIVPMLLSVAFGAGWAASVWLGMMMALNALALAVLTDAGRSAARIRYGWWWVLFLLALGPIALGRIDAVTVPLAIAGLVLLARRPRAAALLLTIGAWVKVWPGAILAAAIVTMRARPTMLSMAIGLSGAIVIISLLLGSGVNVLGFVTQQAGRGLQVEAVAALPWFWAAALDVPGVRVYYDTEILTNQIAGPGVDAVAAALTPLLGLVAAALLVLGGLAVRRGAAAQAVLPPLVLALVAACIVFNKVGSPQFESWLAAPVIAAMLAGGWRAARAPAILALGAAGLTQVIYPVLYGWFLAAHPLMALTATLRDGLLVALLVHGVLSVVRELRNPAVATVGARRTAPVAR